ncbi:MAG: class I SAM-dependent methyltransferase [Flavobacteriales bacterium]|nr:class I SAM-dependent methyltransferase [Flavobacteriales bacterium]
MIAVLLTFTLPMDFKTRGRLSWLAYLFYTLKNRGLVRTCAMGYREWRKERELGIRTFGMTKAETCPTCCGEQAGGHLYQPSSWVLFKQAMAALPFSVKGKVMLDVGSGKGRAMVLAAEAGFAKVIGIEYASGLVDVAHVNIERVRPRFPDTVFELHDGDAIAFALPKDVDVAYLFNPFDAEALGRWMTTMMPQICRPLHIIYMHPVFAHVLDSFSPALSELHRGDRDEFRIYTLNPPAALKSAVV